MLKVTKILVTVHALVGGAAMLSACGQKGPLFLPSTPESAERATLPQTLKLWPKPSSSPDRSSSPDKPTGTPAEPASPASDKPSSASLTSPLNVPTAPTAPATPVAPLK